MVTALDRCYERSDAFVASVYGEALRMKQSGNLAAQLVVDDLGGLGMLQDQSRFRDRYGLFRDWVYSAVNALGMKAAGQPAYAARMRGSDAVGERSGPSGSKSHLIRGMPPSLRVKAASSEVELLSDGPVVDALEWPNEYQSRWQFVYSAVVNLNLTGWAYVVFDEQKGRPHLYSLPTTWVTPAGEGRDKFRKYRIKNPKAPAAEGELIDAANVMACRLPDPQDPTCAYAPSSSQLASHRIDGYIKDSQEAFFHNGIFPGALVTIGKNPHPDVQPGYRPRLTGPQRRQVEGVITRYMKGWEKYGRPLILDGLIESVTRLSMTQNEMGWDKSEDKVKMRILSAYAVNPFVLGERVPGSYAQAKVVFGLFHDRVNTFLDLLGCGVNLLLNRVSDERLAVWWEPCEYVDPSIRANMLLAGRKNGDVSRNEVRAEMGLPSVEEEEAKRSPLLDTVGGMQGTAGLVNQAVQGGLPTESLAYLLSLFLQVPQDEIVRGLGGGQAEAMRTLGEAVAALREPVVVRVEGLEFDG